MDSVRQTKQEAKPFVRPLTALENLSLSIRDLPFPRIRQLMESEAVEQIKKHGEQRIVVAVALFVMID